MKNPLGFDKFKKQHQKDIGDLVIDGFNVVKLIDVRWDEEDYYFQYKRFNGTYYWSSICIGFVLLKNQLSPKDYKELVRVWELNQG